VHHQLERPVFGERWYRRQRAVIQSLMRSPSFRARPYWKAAAVAENFRRACSGEVEESMFFWRAVNAEIWLRVYIDGSTRALDKDSYRRQRAVMLTARALAAGDADRDNAKAFALEAAKLEPTFVPAATLAGRMLAEAGEVRKAARIIERAWQAFPHPDLAQVFADLRFGDTARDRLRRIEVLAKRAPGHIEGALALARAALDAREFAKARAALGSFLAAPTRRVALLMAEIERAEHNDEGRAREWLARAAHAAPDPAWTAEGHVSERWLPVSPSGKLDAFEWRVPITGIASPAPAAESAPEAVPKALDGNAAALTALAAAPSGQSEPHEHAAASPSPEPSPPGPARHPVPPPKPEPVIPLVHAPDDPGPDALLDEGEPRVEPPNGGWRKMFE